MVILTAIRKETRALASLFGPLLVSQYAQIATGIIDTAMTAKLGTVELGSVAVGVALWMPLNTFIVGIIYACLIFVSQLSGADKLDEARRTVQQGMWLGLFLGIAATAALAFLSTRLDWFGVDAALVPGAAQYVRMLSWGLPFMYIGGCIRFYSDGQGIVAPFTCIAIVMVAINAFLNYCLIFGNLGFPRLELEGCGLATGLSMACFFIISTGYISLAPRFANKRLFIAFSRPRMPDIRRILGTGLPIGLNFTSEFLIFSVITMFISAHGAVAAAAHQVTFSSMMFFFALPSALSIALSIIHLSFLFLF
jgi:MATE family multidrug resistance protein